MTDCLVGHRQISVAGGMYAFVAVYKVYFLSRALCTMIAVEILILLDLDDVLMSMCNVCLNFRDLDLEGPPVTRCCKSGLTASLSDIKK